MSNRTIAIFQISTEEDLRFQLDFTGLDLTGRTLKVNVRERGSNALKVSLAAPANLTLAGTGNLTAFYAKASMAAWARGEYEADVVDESGGSFTRIMAVRFVYDDPGKLVYGVRGNQASVTWGGNQAVVTAIGGVGPPGPANSLAIGTVDTLETGEEATASITGSAPNQVLNLGLPKGNTGAQGPQGEAGPQGLTGAAGPAGADGLDGWTPALAVVTDGGRRVLQVADWVGGEGIKPATGLYVGATGLVSDVASAVNIRGDQGPPGSVADGEKVDITVTDGGLTWTVKAKAITFAKMQDVASARILGRRTADPGSIEELPPADVHELLGLYYGLGIPAPAGGALTINLLNAAGATPTEAAPVALSFRSATASDGAMVGRLVTAANSFTVSQGSTLGVPAINTAFHLYLVAFDDGGTLRMGAINCRSGGSLYPLAPTGIASATAEGGAGAADSAQVIYAGAAVAAKAYRVLARLTWENGLAALGNWTQPSKVEIASPGMKMPGDVVQIAPPVSGAGSSTASGSAVDVVGASVTIAPMSAANLIEYAASGRGNVTAGGAGTNSYYYGEFVRGSTILQSVSIAVVSSSGTNMQSEGGFAYSGIDQLNTTSPTIYKIRHYRVSNGTVSTNAASMVVREIQG